MNQKMYEAFSALHRNSGKLKSIEFKYAGSISGKMVEAKISIENKYPKLEVLKIHGYNEAYISKKIKNTFNRLIPDDGVVFDEDLLIPTIGETIRITDELGDTLSKGDTVSIPENTRYYSVNDSEISCNGALLSSNFEATYLGYDNERCIGGDQNMWYYKFTLLNM